MRRPPGKGPFPAVVIFHGGLSAVSEDQLRRDALAGPTHTRFLAAGYVTVTGTHRDRNKDPQAPAVRDCVAVVEHVKKMPGVDPNSVTVMGGSGGGSLVLEVAGETQVAAGAAGEPATILFMGMMNKDTPKTRPGEFTTTDARIYMKEPRRYYTPEVQRLTREKIKRIAAPIFIAHGDNRPASLLPINELLMEEMKTVGKPADFILYPKQPHGFYFGRTGDQAMGLKFFVDCTTFFGRHVKTKPVAIDSSLISQTVSKPTNTPQ